MDDELGNTEKKEENIKYVIKCTNSYKPNSYQDICDKKM